MPSSACLPDEVLEGFATGTLRSADVERLASHLDGCAECQARLALFDARSDPMIEALRRGGTGEESRDGGSLAPSTENATEIQARPGDEVRSLLRRRLIVIGSVAAFVALALSVSSVFGHDDVVSASSGHLGGPIVLGLYGVYALFATLFLRARPDAALGLLRRIELGHLAGAATYAAYYRWASLAAGAGVLFAGMSHRALYVEQAVLLDNLIWYTLIVGYGVLVPNTARRAGVVTIALGVAALGSLLGASLALPYSRDQLSMLLSVTGVGVIMSGAIGVFGSYRIHALQSEVLAARQLGPYSLVRRLGAGGMGEVYLAEHRLLKRPCAVKLIHPERARDARLLQRFEREVQATARLTHPNTVEVFDYGRTDDGTFYYVMEYLQGATLTEIVRRRGPLPTASALRILRRLCGALAEAHAAGLVHRDIKPGNVMLCDRGGASDVVKLLDFGLVRLTGSAADLTQEGVTLGTPEYMSPEQAVGAPTDPRSDIYSLGALAYYLLTGRPPFQAPSALEILIAHRQQAPDPLRKHAPAVPQSVETVVSRCLAKSPGQRFAGTSELDEALAACEVALSSRS